MLGVLAANRRRSGSTPDASFTPSTTQATEVTSAGSTTFTAVDFLDGTAVVCVGGNGDTTDPISVTIDGAAMTQVATTGTADRLTIWVKSGITAGNHDIFVDRTGVSFIRIMSGTLQNIASTTPSSTALLSMNAHNLVSDATSSLTIGAGGIGLVFIHKASTSTFSAWRGGVTQSATSADGTTRRLGTMTVSGTPGFSHTGNINTAVLAAAFDKA